MHQAHRPCALPFFKVGEERRGNLQPARHLAKPNAGVDPVDAKLFADKRVVQFLSTSFAAMAFSRFAHLPDSITVLKAVNKLLYILKSCGKNPT
jgi:hypothetical protein